eukprot:Lithocolla_globosa_v1_NODE_7607_length_924_cov_67.649022.p1 type:complete len:249 gc:universal NODE_7607_length_924_cov_67.649022:49-795(+)
MGRDFANNEYSMITPFSHTVQMNQSGVTISWESLTKQARQLENEIDSRLVSFSKLGSSLGPTRGAATEHLADVASLEVEELLRQLGNVIEQMSVCLKDVEPSKSTTMMHTLQRHRDILYGNTKEHKKTKMNITAIREQTELMNSVQNDIGTFKNGQREDYLMTERDRIGRSHQMTDQIIETAYEAKDQLGRQQHTYLGSQSKLSGTAGRLPLFNSLIQKVGLRKKRDTLIIAAVIAACIIFTLLYIFA